MNREYKPGLERQEAIISPSDPHFFLKKVLLGLSTMGSRSDGGPVGSKDSAGISLVCYPQGTGLMYSDTVLQQNESGYHQLRERILPRSIPRQRPVVTEDLDKDAWEG